MGSVGKNAVWQDREIRFDVKLKDLNLRKGEFEIVFSGTAPEVFPELRLHVRCAGGDDQEGDGRRKKFTARSREIYCVSSGH